MFKGQLSGVQGTQAVGGPRSVTTLDVTFDNLTITSAGFVGPPRSNE